MSPVITKYGSFSGPWEQQLAAYIILLQAVLVTYYQLLNAKSTTVP